MNDLTDIVQRLSSRLAESLPGEEAQLRMAPEPRDGWVPGYIPATARPGAGLLLLYPRRQELHTVLTLRTTTLPKHGGQLSLPGGAVESEESLAQAALREAHEEIGLAVEDVKVVGTLSPLYIPVSGFALHPVVGVSSTTPRFEADPGEVAGLHEVAIRELRDPHRRGEETRTRGEREYRVPYLRVDDQKLWGATAMVVAEMLAVLDSVDAG